MMIPSSNTRTPSLPVTPEPSRIPRRASMSFTPSSPSHIFKSLFITGSINAGASKANLTLYGKIAVPASPPQASYLLFPEGSTILTNHTIHPLNNHQIPYAYPPNSPQLHRAARVLNLKQPSDEHYGNALAVALGHSHLVHTPAKGKAKNINQSIINDHNLDARMTGNITVQNFAFCFISPKFVMPAAPDLASPSQSLERDGRRRRTSFGAASTSSGSIHGTGDEERQKNDRYYVVVMELEVPIVNASPQSPFMIYLHTPSCLSTKIKLRMPPIPLEPQDTSAPQATDSTPSREGRTKKPLSSSRQGGYTSDVSSSRPRWDILTIPSVTYKPVISSHARNRTKSTTSADGFADDEDDESSSIFIEGTFPSTPFLVIRWARGHQNINPTNRPTSPVLTSKSRRVKRKPVSLGHVDSATTYTIGAAEDVPRHPHGVLRRMFPIDFHLKAKCSGLFHGGVETELALFLALAANEDSVGWPAVGSMPSSQDEDEEWKFESGQGCKGWQWTASAHVSTGTDVEDGDGSGDDAISLSRSASTSPTPATPFSSRISRTSSRTETLLSEDLPPTINSRTQFPHISPQLPASLHNKREPLQSSKPPDVSNGVVDLSHSASLLRGPLPGSGVAADYSFENPSVDAAENADLSNRTIQRSATMSSGGASSFRGTPPSTPPGSLRRPLERTGTQPHSDTGSSIIGSGSMVSADFSISDNSPMKRHSSGGSSFSHISLGRWRPPPTQPFFVKVDLLSLLAEQRTPNPQALELEFILHGRFWVDMPEGHTEDPPVTLPLFRFFHAAQHQSKIQVTVAQGATNAGLEHIRATLVHGTEPGDKANLTTSTRVLGKHGLTAALILGPYQPPLAGEEDHVLFTFPPALVKHARPSGRQSTGGSPRKKASATQSLKRPRPTAVHTESDTTTTQGQGNNSSTTVEGSHELVMPNGDNFISPSSSSLPYQTARLSGRSPLAKVASSDFTRTPSQTSRTHATSSPPPSSDYCSSVLPESGPPSPITFVDQPSIASLRINVVPLPPGSAIATLTNPGTQPPSTQPYLTKRWKHIIQVRATWPSSPASESPPAVLDFGLSRASGDTEHGKDPIHMDILSAHIKGCQLKRQVYNTSPSKPLTAPNQSGLSQSLVDLTSREWLSWAVFQLPQNLQGHEGDLEITYVAGDADARAEPATGFWSGFRQGSNDVVEVLLPCFTHRVENIELTWEDVAGYQTVRTITNLQTTGSGRKDLRAFALPPLSVTHLTLVKRKQRPLFGQHVNVLLPSTQTLWGVWALLISLGMLYLIGQAQPELKHLVLSSPAQKLGFEWHMPTFNLTPPPDPGFSHSTGTTASSDIPAPTKSRPPPQPVPDDLDPPLNLWGEDIAIDNTHSESTSNYEPRGHAAPIDMDPPGRIAIPPSVSPSLSHNIHASLVTPVTQYISHLKINGLEYVHQSKTLFLIALWKFVDFLVVAFHYPN